VAKATGNSVGVFEEGVCKLGYDYAVRPCRGNVPIQRLAMHKKLVRCSIPKSKTTRLANVSFCRAQFGLLCGAELCGEQIGPVRTVTKACRSVTGGQEEGGTVSCWT
jgi:hypothetical protein